MARPLKDITGSVFGWLRVLRADHSSPERTKWVCFCDPSLGGCGNETITTSGRLNKGRAVSCGCLRRSRLLAQTTHGHSKRNRRSKEYTAWAGMIDRCYRQESQHYDRYGGRGIRVCDRWRYDFAAFLDDMGLKPSNKHSIDRYPDNNGNYEPGNCRWATQSEQMRNTSMTRKVMYRGELRVVADLSDGTDVVHRTVIDRIDHGIGPEAALSLKPYGMRGTKTYTHNGETRTVLEWARAVGMTKDRIEKRLRSGWPFELAIVPPVPGKRSYAPGIGCWASKKVA